MPEFLVCSNNTLQFKCTPHCVGGDVQLRLGVGGCRPHELSAPSQLPYWRDETMEKLAVTQQPNAPVRNHFVYNHLILRFLFATADWIENTRT
jgi:hypothetical protein